MQARGPAGPAAAAARSDGVGVDARAKRRKSWSNLFGGGYFGGRHTSMYHRDSTTRMLPTGAFASVLRVRPPAARASSPLRKVSRNWAGTLLLSAPTRQALGLEPETTSRKKKINSKKSSRPFFSRPQLQRKNTEVRTPRTTGTESGWSPSPSKQSPP